MNLIKIFDKFCKYPLGRKLFSSYAARKAPYFSSVSPLIKTMEPNYCQIFIKKTKKVQNHIGTMHVIAIANGLEMAMGFMAESSIPKHLRWIPKSMNLEYPNKGVTDILCTAKIKASDWKPGDLVVPVIATDTNNTPVVTGQINLWITEKPKK